MPLGGGVLARFIGPGVGVLNSFWPGGGKFAHQKNCPGVLPGGEWSGLELTNTLLNKNICDHTIDSER